MSNEVKLGYASMFGRNGGNASEVERSWYDGNVDDKKGKKKKSVETWKILYGKEASSFAIRLMIFWRDRA
ncbi:predicted protein [Sclerotinia sclerotiorum 1980 UF-70]|uniref:Uncharacterized protein n=1 Tax=Sclerotinia sclerotiorum (strain ATCC 18683 / 1980 / Ss-1) TaxID=665079 RepID=A7E7S4_SCLS1|nr:predicted protein [Sclerotinia sclerotiorum 1980 UF-70]EDN96426.1 predicted protein [Sclerotinia sclerotiorum 1980 UF-70]